MEHQKSLTFQEVVDRAGVNIFQNSPRNIGEKFPNFLGYGEEFDEIQFHARCRDLGRGSDIYLEGNFSEYKEE